MPWNLLFNYSGRTLNECCGSANHPEIKIGFPIIGIGASAGGPDPFKKVLETLPAEFGAAVVFIQHLLADKKSLLPEILRKQFPSREIIAITNGMTVEKGKVYVNQPDHDITMDSERFRAGLPGKRACICRSTPFSALLQKPPGKAP